MICCCEQFITVVRLKFKSGSEAILDFFDTLRCLAVRYLRHHAIRERDVAKRTAGSGSYRKWLPSAMLRAALLDFVGSLYVSVISAGTTKH